MTIRKSIPKYSNLLFKGPDPLPVEKSISKNMPTFRTKRMDGNYKGYIPGVHHPQYYPARNQGNGELVLRALGQTAVEIGAGFGEAAGYIGNLNNWIEPWARMENGLGRMIRTWQDWNEENNHAPSFIDINNALAEKLSTSMREVKQKSREDWMPIYDTPESEEFMGDFRWFAKNLPSLGSFVSLLIPGWAAARGASAVAKFLNAGRYLTQSQQFLVNGIAGAAVSRHAEGLMEGYAAYDEMIRQGHTEEEAMNAMAKIYRDDAALFFVDVLQFGHLMHTGSKGARALFSRSKDAKETFGKIARKMPFQAFSEGGEEGYQYFAQEEGKLVAQGKAKPGFLFAEGFVNRLDNYRADNELWTSIALGALGGAVAPVAIHTLQKLYKEPPPFSAAYEERVRAEMGAMLSNEENEYLDGKRFLGAALHFARDGRMSDMQDILEGYVEEYEKDDAQKESVKKAKEALGMIPKFEEIFNKAQNMPDYTQGREFKHIKNPASHIRAMTVSEKFGLELNEKLKDHYESKINDLFSGLPEFDSRYENLYRLEASVKLAEHQMEQFALQGEEIPETLEKRKAEKTKAFEKELARLEEAEVPVDNINEKLTTTEDVALQKALWNYEIVESQMEDQVKRLKQIQNPRGQVEYLHELDEEVTQRHDEWMTERGAYLGEGALVGNEYNQFRVKQGKEPDRLFLERTTPTRSEAPDEITDTEREEYRKTGNITPDRRLSIANKLNAKERLTPIEKEMYRTHQNAIEEERKGNLDDNNGKGYSPKELMEYLWNNKMEILDVTEYDRWLDKQVISQERASLEKERSNILADLSDVEQKIKVEEGKLTGDEEVTPEALDTLQKERDVLAERLNENVRKFYGVEDLPFLRRNTIKTIRQLEMEEEEVKAKMEAEGIHTSDGEQNLKKYASHVYRTLAGTHRKKGADGKYIDEVTDNLQQRRFFKWVDTNPIYSQDMHLKLYPILDKDGEIITDNLKRFAPDVTGTTEQLKEKFKNAIYAVVVNKEGKPIDSNNEVITEDQIASLGLFSSMPEPTIEAGEARVMDEELDKIPAEKKYWELAHTKIMKDLRGTSKTEAQDVFIPILSKSMGKPVERTDDAGKPVMIPIARTSPDVSKAGIIIGLPEEIAHQGRQIRFPMGAVMMRDWGTGTITRGVTRNFNEAEVETIYQLIQSGSKLGFDAKLPGKTKTHYEVLADYIHWMAPTETNRGGVVYDKTIKGDLYLYLEGFQKEGDNLYKASEIVAKENELKEWLGKQVYSINQLRLGAKNKNIKFNKLVYDRSEGTFEFEKTGMSYSDYLLDPEQAIVQTSMPPYVPDPAQPQRWNSNLMYNYDDATTGKTGKPTPFQNQPKPKKVKGSRQRSPSEKKKSIYAMGERFASGSAYSISNMLGRLTNLAKNNKVTATLKTAGVTVTISPAGSTKGGSAKGGFTKGKTTYTRKKGTTSTSSVIGTMGGVKKGKGKQQKLSKEEALAKVKEYQDQYGLSEAAAKRALFMNEGIVLDSYDAPAAQDTSATEDAPAPPNKEGLEKFKKLFKESSGEKFDDGFNRTIDNTFPFTNSNYIPEDIEAAEAWFRARFPQVDFYLVHHLWKSGRWGTFTKAGKVLIDPLAQEGTIYHEAWHVASQLFMDVSERNALYNEYRKQYGKKTDTNKEVEEGLANMFMDYVLTGELPQARQAKGFFQKLLQIIKDMLGIKPNVLRAFERINNGYYANLTPDVANITDTFDREIEFKFFKRSAEFSKEAVNHAHMLFLKGIRSRGWQTLILEEGLSTQDYADLYEEVLADMRNLAEQQLEQFKNAQRVYEENLDEFETESHKLAALYVIKERENIALNHGYVVDNFYTSEDGPSLIQLHALKLKQLNVNTPEGVLDELETMADPDRNFSETSINRSQFLSASNEVRFWLSGIYDVREDKTYKNTLWGYRKPLDNAFGVLANHLTGKTTIGEQAAVVRDLTRLYPGMAHVLRDFGLMYDVPDLGTDILKASGSDFLRRNKFFQALSKYKENYYAEQTDISGEHRRTSTNNGNLKRQLFTSWESNFSVTGLSAKIRQYLDEGVIFGFEDALEAAEAMHINIPGIGREVNGEYVLPEQEQAVIAKHIYHIAKEAYGNEEHKVFEQTGDINALIRMEISMNPSYTESSHLNQDNNSVYDNIEYSYYYYMVAALNNIADMRNRQGLSEEVTREMIYRKFPHLQYAYSQNSEIINKIVEGNKIKTSLEESVIGERNSMEFKKLGKADRFIKESLDLSRGVYHLIRPADNSLERTFSIVADDMFDTVQPFVTLEDVQAKGTVMSNLKKYLRDELVFLDDVYNKNPLLYENWKNFTKNIKNREDRSNAGIMLSMMNTPEIAPLLDNFLYSTGTIEERMKAFTSEPRVENALSSGFMKIWGGDMLTAINKYRIKELNILGDEFSNISPMDISMFLSLNYMISVIEQTKLFTGHPAQYKSVDDMIKRMSAVVGPKTLTPVDENTNTYLREKFGIDSGGKISIAVVKDPVVISQNAYEIVEKEGKAVLKNVYEKAMVKRHPGVSPRTGKQYGITKAALYKGFEEADAHAFLSMPTYREFLIRTGAWNYKQEAAWQWQMQKGWQGEQVVIPKNSPFTEIAGEVITRDMVEQNGYILPSLKPHAFGAWSGTPVMTIAKFAVTPLLPELAASSEALQALYDKMESEGIGMTLMDTGNKTGTPLNAQGEVESLYDSEGNISQKEWTGNTLNLPWQYMGIQIPNVPKLKNESSQGTQKDFHVESDLHVHGVPVDFAINYKNKQKPIDFNTVIQVLELPDKAFEDAPEGPFKLQEYDVVEQRVTETPYDTVKIAYDEQIAVLKDAQKAFEGTIKKGDLYDELKGVLPEKDVAMILLNDAMNNLNKIRKRLKMDPVDINSLRSQLLPNYLDDYTISAIDYTKARQAWDALDENQKQEKSGIYQIISELREINRNSLAYGLETAREKLGLTPVRGGYEIDMDKIEYVKSYLRREISKRDMPENMLEAIRYIVDGTDAIVNSQEIEILLKTLITKETTNRKIHGKNMVMVPSTMHELQRKAVYTDPDTGEVFTGSDLRFYKDEKGHVTSMEVYMPAYFKELYGKTINIEKIDPRLLRIIGFRIPTQALSSLESITIKRFLPLSAGDMIIAPSEIVVKTGADFDWDKLFVHLPNYDIVKGLPVYAQYETNDMDGLWEKRKHSFAVDYAGDRILKIYEKYKEDEDIFLEDEDLAESLERALLGGMKDYDNKALIQRDLDMLYAELREDWDALPLYAKNGSKRLDNRKMELQHQLMLMPARFGQLTSPVTGEEGVSVLKDMALELAEKQDANLRKFLTEEEYAERTVAGTADLINPLRMLEKAYELLISKQNISTGALAGTMQVNFAQADVYVTGRDVNLRHNVKQTEDGSFPSMAGIKDVANENYITDVLNELLTAYADSPNDPFIFKINGAGENAMVFATLVVLGVPVRDIVAFLNQPVINWYNDQLDVNKSNYYKAIKKESGWVSNTAFTEQFLENYRKSGYPIPQYPNYDHLSNTEMLWKHAAVPYETDSQGKPLFMDKWNHSLQYSALKEYLRLKELSQDFLTHITASTYNTKHGGKNILSAMLLVNTTDSLIGRQESEPRFVNYEKLYEGNGYLAPYKNAIEEMIKMLKPYHAFMNDNVRGIIDTMIGRIIESKDRNTMEDNIRLLDRFRNELNTAIYQVYGNEAVDGTIWTQEIREHILTYAPDLDKQGNTFFNHKKRLMTVPLRVAKLQEEMQGDQYRYNYLIDNLVPHLKNRTHVKGMYFDNLSLKTISGRKANARETQQFVEAWRELIRQEPQLADDLFTFLMLQSGVSPSPNNFIRAVPHEVFYEKMQPALERFSKTHEVPTWFYKQFALNNRDNRIFRYATNRRKPNSYSWPFVTKGYGAKTSWYLDGYPIDLGSPAYINYRTFASAKYYNHKLDVVKELEDDAAEAPATMPTKTPRKEREEVKKRMSGTPGPVIKIISGGQTGVDQIALRAARDAGMPTGGVAPKGYRTEGEQDDTDLLKGYGLKESSAGNYKVRTLQNIKDSDGTLLFGDVSSPGSKQTIEMLEAERKPYAINPTPDQVKNFIDRHNIQVLNIAGNRKSVLEGDAIFTEEEIYNTIYQSLLRCK